MKHSLRITTDESHIIRRAREIVQELIKSGVTHDEISRLTDTTVLSLLDGAAPTLRRPQFNALALHFNVNKLWLWTGYGPKYLLTQTLSHDIR